MKSSPERRGFHIGSVSGIALEADWSLLIIAWLIAAGLAMGVLPGWHPQWSSALCWLVAVLASVLFFASIAIHELAHALVGKRYGISVRRITLFVFGGLAHMDDEPSSPGAELAMAIAGPVTSLLLGVAATLLGIALAADGFAAAPDARAAAGELGVAATILLWLGPINIVLALFNMVPGFPLDGGRVFRATVWWITKDLRKATRWASALGQWFASLLMAAGVLMALGVSVPLLGVGLVPGLWLVVIGWFLHSGARMSYQALLVRQVLDDVRVAAVMRTDARAVSADLSVGELVRGYVMHSDQTLFPVTERGHITSVVGTHDIRRVPRAAWDETRVGDVATDLERLGSIDASATAREALDELQRRHTDQLAVVRDGALLGFVGERDMMKWISLRGDGDSR